MAVLCHAAVLVPWCEATLCWPERHQSAHRDGVQRLKFTFKVAPHTDNAIVVEQQRFEAWQLREALQADNHVVRQVYAVKLVLQVSKEPVKKWGGWASRAGSRL